MARKLRVEYEGAVYHVTIRGVERRRLFDDDADRERFLLRLADAVELDGVRLYLFCLMSNHVHLVIETPGQNLGRFMHRVQTGYTVYYNLRHRRVGHLMQGRYNAVAVEGDEYLLRLSRYVHLNPVCVEAARALKLRDRIRALRAYPWSSFRSYAGLAKRLDYVAYGPVQALIAGKGKGGEKEYRRFVESGLAETDEEFVALMGKPGWGIGSEEFRGRIRDLHGEQALKENRPEDVAFRRQEGRIDAPLVRRTVLEAWGTAEEDLRRRGRNDWLRPVLARMLCRYAGQTQREAAGALGVATGAAVSIQMKRLSKALVEDRGLQKRVDAIERQLRRHLEECTAHLSFKG